MLGHASAVMTLDTYADLFDDDLDIVSEALGTAAASSNVAAILSAADSTRQRRVTTTESLPPRKTSFSCCQIVVTKSFP